MLKHLHFDQIIVIESLRAKDRRTGKELFDSVIKGRSAQVGLQCSYHYVKDFRELQDLLKSIELAVEQNGLIPLIHIEAHGSPDIIQLESLETIHWGVLSGMLGNINYLTKNNLILSVATCHAINISRAVNIISFPPYYLLVAPDGDAYPHDIVEGYTEFYEIFLEKTGEQLLAPNFDKAMRKLRGENRRTTFYAHLAEMRFEAAWIEFREAKDSEDKINDFVELVSKVNKDQSPELKEHLREVLLATLDPEKEPKAKEYMRRSFLMLT